MAACNQKKSIPSRRIRFSLHRRAPADPDKAEQQRDTWKHNSLFASITEKCIPRSSLIAVKPRPIRDIRPGNNEYGHVDKDRANDSWQLAKVKISALK